MIAQVFVDTGVAHLDRVFDYLVPEAMSDQVRPGVRVKVRFHGRRLSGLVAAVSDHSEQDKLVPLAALVSPEVVMPESSARLFRAVADHCAGTFMDVARLAIPPRHARAEQAAVPAETAAPREPVLQPCAVDLYPYGTGLREAVRSSRVPRACWTVAPVTGAAGDWASGLAGLVADAVSGGRGAMLLVPDATDCARAAAAVRELVDPATVVVLSSDRGPQARYSAFLAASRGRAAVVVGTRAAVYTPVGKLGLIAVWEDGDGSFAEQRFPYPHLRDVVAIRAGLEGAGVVFASRSRSAEVQNWVEKGWLHEVAWPPASARAAAAVVRVATPGERPGRLPHEVFTVIRAGLVTGPVLVWVPWFGYWRNMVCRACGTAVRCDCGGSYADRGRRDGSGVHTGQGHVGMACQVCGRPLDAWQCACGGRAWRAITIGSARTAEELARAFPGVPVARSDSSSPVRETGRAPTIIIATPGCEPVVPGGYAAAVVLDATGYLARADLTAGEQAVRRWLDVVALVAPAETGGTVLIVGPAGDRAVQAVVRLDPAGFAARELADRREAGFPPAARMAVFTGDAPAVDEVAARLGGLRYVELLGPVTGDGGECRLVARVPAGNGDQFARVVAGLAAARSQSGRSGRLTIRLDPQWLGG